MKKHGEMDQDQSGPDGRSDFSQRPGAPPEKAPASPLPAEMNTGSTGPDSEAWHFRHPLVVRLTHWINALCLLVLSVSGLQIYTGRYWFAVGRWHHYFFAWIFALNGLFYAAYIVRTGHFKNLLPARSHLRMLGAGIRHFLSGPQKRAEGSRYIGLRIVNVLQRIGYTASVFGLGPLILLTGLVSSPRGEALLPVLAALFGTRQRAKALHLDITFLLIGYTAVHLILVLLTGFRNNVRAMVTGWYRITASARENEKIK